MDCYLPRTTVACRTLESAYFESLTYAERAPEGAAALTVTVRANELPSATRYVLRFASHGGGPVFQLHEEQPSSMAEDAALLELLGAMQRGTVPFLQLRRPARVADGAFVLEAIAPGDGDGKSDGAADAIGDRDEGSRPFYARPEIAAEMVSQGLDMASLQAGLELNYSTPSFRWLSNGRVGYRHLRVDLSDDEELEGSFTTVDAGMTIAHQLHGGLSGALLGGYGRYPANNLDAVGQAGIGFEWIRHPFLEEESGNYGLRYRMAAVHQDYVTPNVRDRLGETFMRQSLTAFLLWHSSWVDLGADATGTMKVDEPTYWDVAGSLTAAFRIGEALELGAEASIRHRHAALHEPMDADQLDPAARLFGGSDFLSLTYYTQISLSYTFGNALLRSQDQRWR